MRKERIFITQKIDKKTGTVLKTIYPTYESFVNELEHKNTSENESQMSKIVMKEAKEIVTYITDLPMSR